MTIDLTSPTESNFVKILTNAVTAYRTQKGERPSAADVVEALLQAEKAAKQQRLVYPLAPLLGKWRLCFATGTRKVRQRGGIILGKGLYLPQFFAAHISFDAVSSATEIIEQTEQQTQQRENRVEIGNRVQFGITSFKLIGPAQYLGKKNLLAFDFHKMVFSLFGRTLYDGKLPGNKLETEDFYKKPISQLPFFAFFLITEDFIAARGRGGGLAIWIKED
ncbi:MAG: hypothetical protein KME64_13585 [Scytonematopsis contorta HA4267-MV1]|jgi:hypothetical protein|nr:hypothetical protein [Scytonematopsis contorta HA4267-MV1]